MDMSVIKHGGPYPMVVRLVFGGIALWLMLVPLVIADIFIEICHRIWFPVFGIKQVKRSQYIRLFDRAKLPYLTWYEKIGCVYCAYVNGWCHYASVIAGRTEQHFCAIMHLETRGYVKTEYEQSFAKYGSEEALRRRYANHERDFGTEIK